MEEWKKYRLDDFIEFNPTLSLKKGTIARKITMDQLIPHSRDIYSWVYEPYSGGSKFQNGDTIMARITPCLENGKHAFVSLLDNGETAYGSTEYIVMRGKPGISDNLFVYYFSHFPAFKNAAIKSMVGSSGRQRAQVDVLKNLEFYLPGLKEQKMIADSLSALDDKIALNNRINHNLEEQAQALYKSWFVDFEPFKDGKFVDSELGMIPENLEIKRIGEIPHTIESGKRPKGGITEVINGVPSIGAESIKGLGFYDYSKTKFVSRDFANSMKKGIIRGYELLIYKDGGKPGYFIPNFSIFGEGFPFEEMTTNEHVFILDFGDRGFNAFSYFFFQTEGIMNYLNAQGGKAAIPGINRNDIESICIFSPHNQLIRDFGERVAPMIQSILKRCKENHQLSLTRDSLLPRLLSGDLQLHYSNC